MMGAVNQQLVLCEDRRAVRVLTMNRPESRNALNTDLISALHAALTRADGDASVRAVVLTGADPAFCAGLDLTELGQADSPLAMAASGPVLPPLSKPLIGAVNGQITLLDAAPTFELTASRAFAGSFWESLQEAALGLS